MTTGRTRTRPVSAFIQFLLDELGISSLYALSKRTGKSEQVLKRYADQGLDDLNKRLELVDLCSIDRERYIEWMSTEILRQPA
jgi:hypothetical protein